MLLRLCSQHDDESSIWVALTSRTSSMGSLGSDHTKRQVTPDYDVLRGVDNVNTRSGVNGRSNAWVENRARTFDRQAGKFSVWFDLYTES